MSLRINTNISAMNTHRNMQGIDLNLSKSLEKLSSGLRINRASDDAAGLSISETMRGQVRGLAQAE
jgi:flagellin